MEKQWAQTKEAMKSPCISYLRGEKKTAIALGGKR